MPSNYPTATRNALVQVVDTLTNAGSTAGYLQFEYSGVEVATCTMSADAFGTPASGVLTAASITSDTSATGNANAVDAVVLYDGDATEVLTFTFSTTAAGTGEFQMSSDTIGAGDTVGVSSFTITAPT